MATPVAKVIQADDQNPIDKPIVVHHDHFQNETEYPMWKEVHGWIMTISLLPFWGAAGFASYLGIIWLAHHIALFTG